MSLFNFLRKNDAKKGKGFILSLDLSDFTTISEFLSEKGTKGTETLSNIINDRFEYIYTRIIENNGQFIKFIGDEMLAFFKTEEEAARVGNEVIDFFKEKEKIETPWGDIKMGIKGVFDCGEIYVASLKDINVFMGDVFGRIQELKKEVSPMSIKSRISCKRGYKKIKWDIEQREVIPAEHRVSTVMFIEYRDTNLKAGRWKKVKDNMFFIYNNILNREGFLVDVLPGSEYQLFLVLFGAPVAREDDLKRAVELASEIEKKLGTRIAISTGYVYAGSIGGAKIKSYTVLGDVVNETARLLSLDDIKENIRISERSTKSGIKWFDFKEIKKVKVKGKRETITVYVAYPKKSGLEDKLFRYNLVGRENEIREIELLLMKKNGGIIFYGPPGIGKSRLLWEAKNRNKRMKVYEGTCYEGGGELHLLRNLLSGIFMIEESDSPEVISEKIDRHAEINDIEGSVYIKDMVFGLETAPEFIKGLTPELRLQNLYEAFVEILYKENRGNRSILILEDIQWGDATSLKFVADVVNSGLSIMVASARPDYNRDIFSSPSFLHVELKPLGKELWQLGKEILGGKDLEPDVKKLVLERAEGNPFYLEQILMDLIESKYIKPSKKIWVKTDKFSEDRLPHNVFHAVQSRLDKLNSATKEVLKVGSVMGREFSKHILTQILGKDPDRLFKDAEDKGLALKKVEKDEVEYLFKHAIVRDVIYESILVEERRKLHKKVGDTLVEFHKDNLLPYINEVVNHYEKSGEKEKALFYATRGARESKDKLLVEESINLYNRAINLAEDKFEQAKLKCELGEILRKAGNLDKAMKIYKELEKDEEIKKDSRIYPGILLGIAEVSYAYEKYKESLEYIERALSLTEDIEIKSKARNLSGLINMNMGNMEDAEKNFLESLNLYRELNDEKGIARVMGNLFWFYLQMGNLSLARTYQTESSSLMRKYEMKMDLIGLLFNSVSLYVSLAEFKKALDTAEEGVKECENIKYSMALTSGYFMRGNLYRMIGRLKDALKDYEKEFKLIKKIEKREDSETLLDIASIYRRLGEFKKSEEIFERLTPSESSPPEFKFKYFSEMAYSNLWKFDIEKMKENIDKLEKLKDQLTPRLSFFAPYIISQLRTYYYITGGCKEEALEEYKKVKEGYKQGTLQIVDILDILFLMLFYLEDVKIVKEEFENYDNEKLSILESYQILKSSFTEDEDEVMKMLKKLEDPVYSVFLGDLYLRKKQSINILKEISKKKTEDHLPHVEFILSYWKKVITEEDVNLSPIFDKIVSKIPEEKCIKNLIFNRRMEEIK